MLSLAATPAEAKLTVTEITVMPSACLICMGRLIVTICTIAASVAAQDKQKPVSVEITGHILKPEQVHAADERLRHFS